MDKSFLFIVSTWFRHYAYFLKDTTVASDVLNRFVIAEGANGYRSPEHSVWQSFVFNRREETILSRFG